VVPLLVGIMPVRTPSFSSPTELVDFINGAQKVTLAVIAGGGGGYSDNDLLTVVGGEGDACVLKVTSQAAGVITGVSIETEGAYITNPTNPVSVAGGTGSGATFTLTLASIITGMADVGEIIENSGRWYVEYWT